MSTHVLFIAKAFNNTYSKTSGIFVREQAVAVSKQGVKTGLIAVNFVSWWDLLRTGKIDFGFREYNDNGVCALVYQVPVWPKFRWVNYKRRDRMLKKLSEDYMAKYGKPDLVHLHGFYCGNEAIRLKKSYQIPFITTEHYSAFAQNLVHQFEDNLAARTYAESAYRIAVSNTFVDFLWQRFGLIFNYLPNIVDVSKFSIRTTTVKHPGKTLIHVGKLDKNKNQTLLIHAFALLKDDNAKLVIAGTGPCLSRLQKLASTLGLSNKIQFLGYVPNEKLEPLFHQADLLVVASKYETFGVVMIEAMCCGVPVVSTPVGAATDLLVDKRLGLICEPNPVDMANCIEKMLNEVPDKNFIHNYVTTRFSAEHVSANLVSIYQNNQHA